MSNTSETVALSRAEYEALLERIEEAEDLAAIAAAEAREAALGNEKARATICRSSWSDASAPASTRSAFGAPIATSPARRSPPRGLRRAT
jgi:hypothetical protein